MWICEFVKNLALRGQSVRFFDAREITPARLSKGGDIFEDHSNSDAVFCFDGIDEIRDQEIRTAIKEKIAELKNRCVITTRP